MFRDWLKLFEDYENAINDLMDKHGMILFFKKGNDLFGGGEDSRIVFAKMKTEDDPIYQDQAKFLGINLLQSILGQDPVQNMFGSEDLPNIKVCDRNHVVKTLIKHHKKKKK